ncbi:MAG: acetate--CoA ligase family protein [Hyphomicrobiaceae bacterium]
MSQPTDVSLDRLFAPDSVAVIGATENPSKWGYQYCRRLLAAKARRRVYLVNQNRTPVLGHSTFASIDELPETPDVAVLCVPKTAILEAVEAAARKGVRYAVCITAGFAETGAEGRVLQERIVAAAHAGGMRLVGPNCLGLIDTRAEFHCTAFWDVTPGPIGLVSQSGTILLELGVRLTTAGLGFSRGVSIGNQADLQLHEYMESFVDEPATRVVVAYVEEFKDGRAFLGAAQRVIATGKHVVLIAPYGSEAVARSVSSHTGSLVSSDTIIDAAASRVGIVRVTSIAEMMRAIDGLLSPARARGRRLAVLSDGGGCATIATGVAGREGFTVPAFSDTLKEQLKTVCTPESGIGNPVDYVKGLDIEVFVPVAEIIARSGEVDAIVMSGFLNNVRPEVDPVREKGHARRILSAVTGHGLGLAISTVEPAQPAMDAFRAAGIPVLDHPDEALRSLRLGFVDDERNRALAPIRGVEPLRASPGYLEARALFASTGITFASALSARSKDEVMASGQRLGYPIVLKGLGQSHKSDSGAVALAIKGDAELSAAFDDMYHRLQPDAFSVETMVDGSAGVEILIGAVRDRAFGPTIAVGLGGVLTEVLRDTVVALAPVDVEEACRLLLSLKGAQLLKGFRSKPAVDLQALGRTVSAFSRFVADHPEISEAELNPVIALSDKCVAVDARIVVADTA